MVENFPHPIQGNLLHSPSTRFIVSLDMIFKPALFCVILHLRLQMIGIGQTDNLL